MSDEPQAMDKTDLALHTSLHPAQFSVFPNPPDVVEQMQGAHRSAYQAGRQLFDQHGKIMKNPLNTEMRNMQEYAKFADQVTKAPLRNLDAVLAAAEKREEVLRESMRVPSPRDHLEAETMREIRTHVRSLPADERNEFIEKAMEKGDHLTIAALLGDAPGYLVGINEQMMQAYQRQYAQTFHADAVAELEHINKAREIIRGAGEALLGHREKLVDRKGLAEAESQSAAAKVAAML